MWVCVCFSVSLCMCVACTILVREWKCHEKRTHPHTPCHGARAQICPSLEIPSMYQGMYVLTCTHVYICVCSCAHMSQSCMYSCAHVSLPRWALMCMCTHFPPSPVLNSGWWQHQPHGLQPNTQTSLVSPFFPSLTLTFPHHSQPMPEYFSIASSPCSPSPLLQPVCSPPSTHPPHSGNQNYLSQ